MITPIPKFAEQKLPSTPNIYSGLSLNDIGGQTFGRDEILPLSFHRIWLIEQGYVRTVSYSESGDVITLGLWGTGDVVGRPLSQNGAYEVQCLVPARCRLIQLKDINIAEVRSRQMQQMEVLLNILHCRRVHCRMLMLLTWLAEKYGHICDRGCILDLRLTHQAIAEIIGSTRVTVTRLLNDLETEGKLIKLKHQKILLKQIN
jgi:CRP-like cAMP-binding protein